MNDETHRLSKTKNKNKKNDNGKEKYISVVFPTVSPNYKNKRYYYRAKKDFKSGEKIYVVTGNNPKVKVTVMNPNVKKRPKRRLIREVE